jgi:hypothetical protein
MGHHLDRGTGVRTVGAIALAAAAVALAACGGDSKPAAPPGSPENPLVAKPSESPGPSGRSNEAAAPLRGREQAGYQELVERQSSRPGGRFSPCNLVTRAQARAIVGGPVGEPVEAPLGPTCIYPSGSGKRFVTVAVQSVTFDKLKRQMYVRRRVEVADRTAYCGTHGQPVLYVPLTGGRVLTIAAPCSVARGFAARAMPRLNA